MIQRNTGVAIWRQIADQIRQAISAGEFGKSGRLPPEMELAQLFGVNRHTVRAAIAALAQEGLLRAEQGRGTLILRNERLKFPISQRTRFSDGFADQASTMSASVLSHATEDASPSVAAALRLNPLARVLRLDMIYVADGLPVARAINWFEAERFAGMATACEETGSITRAYERLGINDYVRLKTKITASHAEEADLAHLRLSPGAVVVRAFSVNGDVDGRPIQAAETRFAADRVTLEVGDQRGAAI